MKHTSALALAGAALGVIAQTCLAETAVLEEITVTAQKRAQTLEQVPIAVAVLGGDFLSRQNVGDIGGLNELVPNLHVSQTPFNPIVNIRGVGSGGGARTFEQSVATYVDDVYAGRANQFLNPFFDVQRIEVVRGPQGVLFGVNAVAGGINIVNNEPAGEFEGTLRTSYEFENESYRYEGAVSLPVNDALSIRLAGARSYDGPYLENQVPGGIELETDSDIVRAVVKWRPADDVTVKLSGEAAERETSGSPFQMYALGTNTLPVYGYPIDRSIENGILDFKRSSADSAEHTHIKPRAATLHVSWNIGDNVLTSVTGYSKYEFDQAVPAASLPLALGDALAEENFKQTYQEIRLASSGKRSIDYLVGAVYFKQEDDLYQGIDLVLPSGPAGFRNGLVAQTESYAAFAQLTYNITDTFRAVAGARYSSVKKTADYTLGAANFGAPLNGYVFSPAVATAIGTFAPLGWLTFLNPLNPAPELTRHSLTLHKVDPSLSLQVDLNDHTHPYLTFSKATKAGGFDDQNKSSARTAFEYKPETATSVELGVKFNFSRLQLNADVFHTKFKDLQVTVPAGNNVVTRNAASITSQGVEVDMLFQATDRVRIGGDLTYLDAKYDDFPGVGCITPLDALQAVLAPCSIEAVASPAQTNARGRRVEFSPRYTASLYVDGDQPLAGSLTFTWGGRAYYNDGYNMNANGDPIDVQGSYALYDAYLGVDGTGHGDWSLKLLGKNLGNRVVLENGGLAGLGAGHQGIVAPGREVFLTASWNF